MPSEQLVHVKVEDTDNDSYFEDEDEDDSNPLQEFETKTKLRDAKVQQRSLEDLIAMLDAGNLILDPEYQRGVVWDQNRMIGLIDSLMENYYVPPIIFHKKLERDEEGAPLLKRVCVDGKQRISSIKAFVNGKIPCHDRKGARWYYGPKRNKDGTICKSAKRRVIPAKVKEDFCKKKLVTYEFTQLLPSQEEDLFARVQKGVQLSAAEKLRATTGPWQELAKTYERDFTEVVTLAKHDRSTGFRHVLCCFAQILETMHPSSANGVPRFAYPASSIVSLTKNPRALDADFKAHLLRVFTTFKQLVHKDPQAFKDSQYSHSKAFAPVELVACAVLVFLYGNSRNHDLLLGDIRAMRLTLRQNLQDLRLNRHTWNCVWELLDTLEDFRGAVQSNATPEAEDVETTRPTDNTQTATVKDTITPRAGESVGLKKELFRFTVSAPISPEKVASTPKSSTSRAPAASSAQTKRYSSHDSVISLQHNKRIEDKTGRWLPRRHQAQPRQQDPAISTPIFESTPNSHSCGSGSLLTPEKAEMNAETPTHEVGISTLKTFTIPALKLNTEQERLMLLSSFKKHGSPLTSPEKTTANKGGHDGEDFASRTPTLESTSGFSTNEIGNKQTLKRKWPPLDLEKTSIGARALAQRRRAAS